MTIQCDDASACVGQKELVNASYVGCENPDTGKATGLGIIDWVLVPVGSENIAKRASTSGSSGCKEFLELPIFCQAKVSQVENNIVVEARIFGFIDNQGAGETQCHLLHGHAMGVIPVCSGIRGRECVSEAFVLTQRELGQIGNTVHLIG